MWRGGELWLKCCDGLSPDSPGRYRVRTMTWSAGMSVSLNTCCAETLTVGLPRSLIMSVASTILLDDLDVLLGNSMQNRSSLFATSLGGLISINVSCGPVPGGANIIPDTLTLLSSSLKVTWPFLTLIPRSIGVVVRRSSTQCRPPNSILVNVSLTTQRQCALCLRINERPPPIWACVLLIGTVTQGLAFS